MSFSNLDYFYQHLPARFRREDEGLFLKRFLTWFGRELDRVDRTLDDFHRQLAPETASEAFLNWWLYALFGWSWFPDWFDLEKKRAFYAEITRHYARHGTARGIETFLRAFGIRSRVFDRPIAWGEWAWGDDGWAISDALGIVVRLFPTGAGAADLTFWSEFVWGEGVLAEPQPQLKRVDVEALLRFQAPFGHVVMIEDRITG